MGDDFAEITSTRMCRALEALGFAMKHGRTRHVVFVHPDGRRLTVPVFMRRIVPTATLRAILRDGEINDAEFLAALP